MGPENLVLLEPDSSTPSVKVTLTVEMRPLYTNIEHQERWWELTYENTKWKRVVAWGERCSSPFYETGSHLVTQRFHFSEEDDVRKQSGHSDSNSNIVLLAHMAMNLELLYLRFHHRVQFLVRLADRGLRAWMQCFHLGRPIFVHLPASELLWARQQKEQIVADFLHNDA